VLWIVDEPVWEKQVTGCGGMEGKSSFWEAQVKEQAHVESSSDQGPRFSAEDPRRTAFSLQPSSSR
jgi:hypothetical protein